MPINNFLLPGAKFIPAYEVANSCRFNSGDAASLQITPGSAGSLLKWTFSTWVKRSKLSGGQQLLSAGPRSAPNVEDQLYILDGGEINWYDGTSNTHVRRSSNLFKDPSAWYHFVFVWDTANGTANNRARIYVNGSEITYGTRTTISQNANSKINGTGQHRIGAIGTVSGEEFDGYMAETVFVNDQALTPTSFGEFDDDTPTIWKPKDVSELSFGTNGFYLDFEDSGDLGDDESGNGNDFTENNLAATDQATDTPTNNFATWNPLQAVDIGAAFSEGNLFAEQGAGTTFNSRINSTIGVSAGKWYAEFKYVQISNTNTSSTVGVSYADIESTINPTSTSNGDVSLRMDRSLFNSSTETSTYSAAISNNDIIGIALDMDNKKVYFSVGGTWANSSNPADGTNSLSIAASSTETFMVFNCRPLDEYIQANFGNPPFSISSGNADANGYGNFEYAVPSGFYALCTKNLAEFG